MRIGIMGGTLDPVHNGHLQIARRVRAEMGLDGVMLLPAGDPPHKRRRSDKLDRLEMARRAAAGEDGMFASDIEITRKGTTYTVDTLRALRERQPEAEWVYIIGADTLNILESWRNFAEIAKMCAFAAVGRPGVQGAREHAEALKAQYGARIEILQAAGPEISSTGIRARVAEGKSIAGLVPEEVEAYIRERGMYLCDY
ncbi:MAG: nicotinate-nucleotide adenylyltransferase, partial [Candidatus Faecivicinus sp.]|nr:nicotinate-nucleotide adenylyltransferase [Candidatus Faecivicinus sp.]